MANLNINESLTYSMPDVITDGSLTYVSYKPISGQSFGPNESITIKISSNTQMMDLQRSYLKFTTTTSAVGTVNPQGFSSVFNSVSDTFSGFQLPISRAWHVQNQCKLTTDTSERKQITSICESYREGSTGVATGVNTSFITCMPVPTSIETNKLIPLPVMNAGWMVTYQLNPSSTVVSAGTYTVTSVELVCAMIQPEQDYLQEVSKGLGSGGALKIPVGLYRSVNSTLSASNFQNLIIQCGYLSSINTITIVEKTAALGLARNGSDISGFRVNLDGQIYPQNKSILGVQENIYQILAGYNTTLSTLSPPDSTQTFQQYSFKSNANFGSGIPTQNGTLELDLEFVGGVVAGSTIETIIQYDAILVVSANGCYLVTDL